MKAAEIRRSFVDFFTHRGHTHVPSSSLVPHGDPTLLFTNAGMVQFKRVFQGLDQRDYKRAVTVQKCVRAGGKHNDLEEVGHTTRHHTFFEMLGNFSFGDYFKRDAVAFGWEWVTGKQFLGIDPDKIYVTVHHSDADARKLWHDVTGIAEDRIYGLSDKDNFWQMGDTGPCGPCSEIHVDLRPTRHPLVPSLDDFVSLAEAGAFLEIWNLVFMQFDQAANGTRKPLPAPSVDTGAGLDRIASVMQGVDSNFHTDLMMPIIRRGEEIVGRAYDRGPAGGGFRVMADHARAVAFLLADDVYPSNEGRGYVLRRILRRAVRHAWLLGRTEPTLTHLTGTVIETMGEAYPELRAQSSHIASVTKAEEEGFLETIDGGLKRLDQITSGSPGTISGDEAFKLYDTYGFPLDLTQVIATERGWRVDSEGFERALASQQQRSRTVRATAAAGGDAGGEAEPALRGAFSRVKPRVRQRFIGYEETEAETDILAYRQSGRRLDLILHENPFYAASGGQVSDTGTVQGEGWTLSVDDVIKAEGKQVVTGPVEGEFEPTNVRAEVARQRRRDIERNHTATHLVHAALRRVLGEHVHQAGSVVAPDRLRFDFSHHAPVNPADLAAIEREVNRGVWENAVVETYEMAYKDAIAKGAIALFGEKYGDRVRVVDIDRLSVELCGGTHVRTTGQIGLFHFTHESGVAAGVRRIEAVTGPGAYDLVKTLDERIAAASGALRTSPEHLARKVEGLLEERRRLEKQVEELLRSGGGTRAGDADGERHQLGDATLEIVESPLTDRNQIAALMDAFRGQARSAVKVLFTAGERPGVHVAVTDDLISRGVRAGDVAQQIASVGGGKGGGRPHFASGGLGDPGKLEETRRRTPDIVRDALSAAGGRA